VSEKSTSVPAEGIDVAVLGRCARREREEKEGSFLFEKLEDRERVSDDRRGETLEKRARGEGRRGRLYSGQWTRSRIVDYDASGEPIGRGVLEILVNPEVLQNPPHRL
jgi:hypothetical protein